MSNTSPASQVALPKVQTVTTYTHQHRPTVMLHNGRGITTIGDSIMIDITPDLQRMLPGIVCDGRVGRQMIQASRTVSDLKVRGALGSRVVIELGTNGPFTAGELEATLRLLGPVEQIILVNTRVPRFWQGVVNETLAQVAAKFPHTTLVNWYEASANHPNYFYPDGVHLNPVGAHALATLIVQALSNYRAG